MNENINNKQKRDTKTGHFQRVPGVKRYTVKDIEKAYLAGLSAQSVLSWQALSWLSI